MKLKDLKQMEGTSHHSKWDEKYTIIQAVTCDNILIQFEDSNSLIKVRDKNIAKGDMSNPNRKVVRNVGYLGYGDFKVCINGKKTEAYIKWHSMIERVHGIRRKGTVCYNNCSVAHEWLNFQSFAKWYYEHLPKMQGYVGKICLDQDLLKIGNTEYGPETCSLIPYELNIALKISTHFWFNKERQLFEVKLTRNNHSLGPISKYIGRFNTEQDCITAYSKHKDAYILQLADRYKEYLTNEAFLAASNLNTKERFINQQKGTNVLI